MWNTLRQFSLQYCELPIMIENIAIFLRCLTINIDSRFKKGIPTIYYVITVSIFSSYLYVYFFSTIWFVFIRCSETGDVVAAMVILSLGLTTGVAPIKMIFMAFNSEKLREIIDHFLECDGRVIPGSRFSNNMMKTLRSVKSRAVLYWVALMMDGLVYNSIPLLLPGRHLSEDNLVLYGLEPIVESPNYEIAYTLITAAASFVCFSIASTSGFIIILIGYVEANMLSLSEEIKDIWKDAVTDKKGNKTSHHLKNQPIKIVNMHVKNRLAKIIEIHNTSISLLNNVEHLFRVPVGLGFLCQTIAIIAELLGGLENTYLQTPFALVQISMDCYIGQKVMDASLNFAEAVYDCKWEQLDNSNMKIVLKILQNSQITMKMTAGGMTIMNFTCLMSVLQYIYSTYTTLRPIISAK